MNTQLSAALYAIKVDLGRIDGNAPFTTTIGLVSNDLTLINNARPCPSVLVDFTGEDENVENRSGMDRVMMRGHVNLLIQVETPTLDESATTQLQRFIGDVQYAMTAPAYTFHGGTVYVTQYMGQQTFPATERAIQGAILRFDFLYSFPGTIAV